VLLALVAASSASADGPSTGRLLVPGDHFQPGASLTISGSEISGRQVSLRLERGEMSVDMGSAAVGLEGTFEAIATVPATFPLGYAEITATDENGNVASVIILIGDRAEGPGAQPGGATAPLDDRAIGLTLAAIGTLLFLIAGAWYVRIRRKDPPRAR
jgi:hypothetical protein